MDPLFSPDLQHPAANTLLMLIKLFVFVHILDATPSRLTRVSHSDDHSQSALQKRVTEEIVAVEQAIMRICRDLVDTVDIDGPDAEVRATLRNRICSMHNSRSVGHCCAFVQAPQLCRVPSKCHGSECLRLLCYPRDVAMAFGLLRRISPLIHSCGISRQNFGRSCVSDNRSRASGDMVKAVSSHSWVARRSEIGGVGYCCSAFASHVTR